jgi:hypothetical protein
MITFRTMRTEDIPAGLALCRSANWNQLARDWELFLKLSVGGLPGCNWTMPEMSLVPSQQCDMRIILAGSGWCWWIPAQRRQGIGISLLKESLRILRFENTVKLDATPAGREVYLKLDFRDEYYLSRMHCSSVAAKVPNDSGVRQTKSEDLPQIFGYDHKVFGANRDQIIEWIWMGAPKLSFVYERGSKILGYCFARVGFNHTHIGPVVAREEQIAKELVSAVLVKCTGKSLIIDAHTAQDRGSHGWNKTVSLKNAPLCECSLATTNGTENPKINLLFSGLSLGNALR